MNDLEKEIKGLPLRDPSLRLDERVLAQRPRLPSGNRRPVRAGNSLRGILVWSVASCLVGFLLGRVSVSPAVLEPLKSPMHPRVAATFAYPAERNPFDTTVPARVLSHQEWVVTAQTEENLK